ncbi:MAG: glycoside hydrolase family 28 protein [Bacillota bacterium]
MTLRRVSVRNPWYAQNGDGLDLESCRHALVEDCTFDVGDDAICMKSGKDEEGWRRGKATEYVAVRGCTVYHGHGGIVIGSEMSGGVRHVLVEDCDFIGTDVGLRFKSTRGAAALSKT